MRQPSVVGAMVPRMQLLLVEDDPTMQLTLQRALARRGMEVTAVGDGAAALRQWAARLPDAVVLDGDLREASAAASDQLADEGANAFKPAEPDEFGANPDDDFAQDALF